MKTCNCCHKAKPKDRFYNSKDFKDGKMPRCIACCSEHRKKGTCGANPNKGQASKVYKILYTTIGMTLTDIVAQLDHNKVQIKGNKRDCVAALLKRLRTSGYVKQEYDRYYKTNKDPKLFTKGTRGNSN